jgi:hypothetical protein
MTNSQAIAIMSAILLQNKQWLLDDGYFQDEMLLDVFYKAEKILEKIEQQTKNKQKDKPKKQGEKPCL